MSHESIQALIPHRPPMLLIDEVVESGPQRIVCRKTFRAEEYFFQGHYPDGPIVPGVILCEVALQAGAVLLSQSSPGSGQEDQKVPVVTRMNNVKFKRMVAPGETVEAVVSIKEELSGAFFLSARVQLEGQLAASLEFACTFAARPESAVERVEP